MGVARSDWLVGVLALMLADTPTKDPCERMMALADYRMAAAICGQVFLRTHDASAGIAAARAHLVLGNHDDAMRLGETLLASAETATALQIIGNIHARRGLLAAAQTELSSALALHRERNDHVEAARDAYHLTSVHQQQSQYREAIADLRTTQAEASKGGDVKMQGYALMGLGFLFEHIGDAAASERAYEAAARVLADTNVADWVNVRLRQAQLDSEMGRSASARETLLETLRLAEQSGRADLVGLVHLRLATELREQSMLEAAAVHLEQAGRCEPCRSLQVFPAELLFEQGRLAMQESHFAQAEQHFTEAAAKRPVREQAWQLQLWRGRAAEARGDDATAEAAFRRAIELLEAMRRDVQIDDFKAWLLATRRQPYEALFRLLSRTGRNDQALAVAESAQAQAFMDAFVSASAAAADVPKDGQPERTSERAEALGALLPALRSSPVVALQPIRSVLAELAADHVLSYLEIENGLWLAELSRGRVRLVRLSDHLTEVQDLAQQFTADPGDASAAEKLGTLLVPASVALDPRTPLYLVPSAALAQVPFAALRPRGRFLVETSVLAYAPSLTALASIHASAPAPSAAPVVLGDPRGDLPAARDEAARVARWLSVPAFTGPAASRARLRAAERASVLHIAGHSGVSPRGAWLALADGEVGADDVLGWRVRPRLVVLASCASGATRVQGPWGALASLFLAAGSQSVIATLRSVEDAAAARLVTAFYQSGGARDPAAALARAQRTLALSLPPSAWGSFVLLGSARPLANR